MGSATGDAAIVWGATLILCVSVGPLVHMRNLANGLEAAARAKNDADLARLPPNSPLWEWTPFLATRDDTKAGAVLDRIRRLASRSASQPATPTSK